MSGKQLLIYRKGLFGNPLGWIDDISDHNPQGPIVTTQKLYDANVWIFDAQYVAMSEAIGAATTKWVVILCDGKIVDTKRERERFNFWVKQKRQILVVKEPKNKKELDSLLFRISDLVGVQKPSKSYFPED